MKNSDAVHRFLEHKAGSSANVTSDGTSLWSYGWYEMARWVDGPPSMYSCHSDNGTLVVRHGKRFSPTTSRQMELLIGCMSEYGSVTHWGHLGHRNGAFSEETPRMQARMNV